MSHSRARHCNAVTVFLVAAVVAGAASGQTTADIDPTGGLRSKGLAPRNATGSTDVTPPNATREELARKWDLDGNGTIDPGEANIARIRLRRERRELQIGPSFDPLTGRFRTETGDDATEPSTAPVVPAEPPPAPRRTRDEEPTPPGTRLPAVKPPIVSPTVPDVRAPHLRSSTPSMPDAGSRPRSAARQPTDRGERAGSLTGGVRAGAPAARQGYGSLVPQGDLNAGRAPLAPPRGPLPAGARPVPGGGLLPSLRRPALPGSAAAPVPQPPPPPSVRPRITAEDIGGF